MSVPPGALPLGLGFGPAIAPPTSPSSLQPTITSTAPTLTGPAPTTAAPDTGVPQLKTNPLGAIGAVLLNIQRGAEGKPLFTEELKSRRLQKSQLELKRLSVGVDAMDKGLDLMAKLPAEEQAKFATAYAAKFEEVIPGFAQTFQAAAKNRTISKERTAALGEFGKELIGLAGSLEGAVALLGKPEVMKQITAGRDAQNAPDIHMAFNRVGQVLKASGQGDTLLAKAQEDGWTMSDLEDPQIREAFGLEQTHLNTIRRSPELQNELRQFGFIPTQDIELAASEKIKRQNAKVTPTKVQRNVDGKLVQDFVNPNNGQKMFSIPTNIDAKSVTPTTASDLKAAAALRLAGIDPAKSGLKAGAIAATENMSNEELTTMGQLLSSGQLDISFNEDGTIQNISTGTGANQKAKKQETLQAELRGAQTATLKLVNLGERTIEAVLSEPDINTAGAAVQRFAGNLAADIQSLMKTTGFNPGKNLNLPDDHPDKLTSLDADAAARGELDHLFGGLKNRSAAFKGMMFNLAVAAASAVNGQEGRGLSDKDLALQIEALGLSASDPQQLASAIRETMKTAYENLRIDHIMANGDPFTGTAPDFPSFERVREVALGRENAPQPEPAPTLSQDEILKLVQTHKDDISKVPDELKPQVIEFLKQLDAGRGG